MFNVITWDYGKEINVTLEDALFSAKSMAIMFGSVDKDGDPVIGTTNKSIIKTVPKSMVSEAVAGDAQGQYTCKVKIRNEDISMTNASVYNADGTDGSTTEYAYVTGTITASEVSEIIISAETFPGTYYCTGDTYARSEATGEDEFFQLVIPKAKVTSENTLTMEAEGDPSTFSMNLKVLRPADGNMMKLIKYSLA